MTSYTVGYGTNKSSKTYFLEAMKWMIRNAAILFHGKSPHERIFSSMEQNIHLWFVMMNEWSWARPARKGQSTFDLFHVVPSMGPLKTPESKTGVKVWDLYLWARRTEFQKQEVCPCLWHIWRIASMLNAFLLSLLERVHFLPILFYLLFPIRTE